MVMLSKSSPDFPHASPAVAGITRPPLPGICSARSPHCSLIVMPVVVQNIDQSLQCGQRNVKPTFCPSRKIHFGFNSASLMLLHSWLVSRRSCYPSPCCPLFLIAARTNPTTLSIPFKTVSQFSAFKLNCVTNSAAMLY